MNVIATSREISREETIVRARARKKTPATPSRKAKGMKTTTGVSVLPTRAGPTSCVTDRMAWDGDWPASSFAWMASTTTIASSITMPMAAAIPPSVIRLKLMWKMRITTSVTSTVTGIPMPTTNAPVRLRKNR